MQINAMELTIDSRFSFFEGGTVYGVVDLDECDGVMTIEYLNGDTASHGTADMYLDDTLWLVSRD